MKLLISEEAAKILDLLEQIESVNKILKVHAGDTFMQQQYLDRKRRFVQKLAQQLKAFDIQPKDMVA